MAASSSKTPVLPERIDRTLGHVEVGGERINLTDLNCMHCGKQGCPYLAYTIHGEFWSFCSREHRLENLRIAGRPLTATAMETAGMAFVSSQP